MSNINKLYLLENLLKYKNKRCIVFDCETTGTIYNLDNALEFSAVEVIDRKITGNVFRVFINGRKEITAEAKRKNKFDDDYYEKNWREYSYSEKENLENFLKFCSDSPIFAHYSIFDYNFLNKELSHHGLSLLPYDRFFCTIELFNQLCDEDYYNRKSLSNSLDDICKHFNIEIDIINRHSGLYDAYLAAKLLIKIFKLYDFMELEKYNCKNKIFDTNFELIIEHNLLLNEDTNEIKKCIKKDNTILKKKVPKEKNKKSYKNDIESNHIKEVSNVNKRKFLDAVNFLFIVEKDKNYTNNDIIYLKTMIQRCYKPDKFSIYEFRDLLFIYLEFNHKKKIEVKYKFLGENLNLIKMLTKINKIQEKRK